MSTPCIGCQQLHPKETLQRGRCPKCRIPTTVTYRETQRRRDAVNQHRREYGPTCPGYLRDPHPSNDLTADHTTPRLDGGEGGPLRILCRSCNSKRGAGRVDGTVATVRPPRYPGG